VNERSERHSGLRHATAAGVPRRGPERLQQAARLAAVRAVLGDALGGLLLGLREEPERIVLLLAGDGWERGLAPHLEALVEPVARALEAAPRPVAVESGPLASRPPPPRRPPAAAEGAALDPVDPQELRRRLAAAAERLLARADARGGG